MRVPKRICIQLSRNIQIQVNMPPEAISIVEVGPRDGLQSEPDVVPTAIKIEFIRRLIDSGLRRIEAVSFVNPKRVPQMADAEAVMAGVPRNEDVIYIGLALNERGFERAAATGIDEVGFAVVASDTFNRRNQGSRRTQFRNVSAVQPIFSYFDEIAAHCDPCSDSCANTSRTALSLTSGEYCPLFFMTPSSQRLESPANPARFTPKTA